MVALSCQFSIKEDVTGTQRKRQNLHRFQVLILLLRDNQLTQVSILTHSAHKQKWVVVGAKGEIAKGEVAKEVEEVAKGAALKEVVLVEQVPSEGYVATWNGTETMC